MSDELKPVAKIVSADEYGPRLEWTTHWVDLIGKTLYVVDTHPPTGDAAGKDSVDAARYRWLREAPYDTAMAAMFDFDGPTPIVAWRRATVQLDRAIDAAIATGEKT